MNLYEGLIWNAIDGGSGGGGGGGDTAERKQVNFYDYDGSLLHSYTGAEFGELSVLPDNPSHNRLVATGWNWTKEEIAMQLTKCPNGAVNVGQTYDTASGDTEIDIVLDGRLWLYLNICVDGEISVNWGDGTTESITGTSPSSWVMTRHTYPANGSYMISIHKVSGNYYLYGGNSPYKTLIGDNSTQANGFTTCVVIGSCVRHIRVSSSALLKACAFYYLIGLEDVTLPNNIYATSVSKMFEYCFSLNAAVMPRTQSDYGLQCPRMESARSCEIVCVSGQTTSFESYVFQDCTRLKYITVPYGVSTIPMYFVSNTSVEEIHLPDSVTTFNKYAFSSATRLRTVTAKSLTSISTSLFNADQNLVRCDLNGTYTSIQNTMYSACYLLPRITVPVSVTAINVGAFSSTKALVELHLLPTTPPTLSGELTLNDDCVIYVPTAKVNDYKTAQYWSTHADKIVGE